MTLSPSPVTFSTPSPFDLRSLTIMGINAKPNAGASGPIGFFGTGLKYAFAVLLREGCTIHLRTPDTTYDVISTPTNFRGKEFNELALRSPEGSTLTLPFTTELGKNWTPLMAYRELVTNTRDEQGTIHDGAGGAGGAFGPGLQITVTGDAISTARSAHSKMFLDPEDKVVLETLPDLEICRAHSHPGVFYRGVKVLDHLTHFTYNITTPINLTEDRTAQIYFLENWLAQRIWLTRNPEVMEELISGSSLEAKGATSSPHQMSEEFAREILHRREEGGRLVRFALCEVAYAKLGCKPKRKTLAIVGSREKALAEALRILRANGHDVNYPIELVEESPDFVGLAERARDTITLTTEVFRRGLPCVVGTLLEEYIHLRHHHADETREFQNFVLDAYATLMVDIHLEGEDRR